MSKNQIISVSAPGKIHLLGEHTVVYGKPALLAAVGLRITVTICHPRGGLRFAPQDNINKLKKIIEPIVNKKLDLKTIPPYEISIISDIPVGAGLGSSAAVSVAYITALLIFLKVKWDLNLINNLAYEAEKIFHGNPSGGDNTTVVYGGLISYTKGKPIQPLSLSITPKLAKNFVLINTGKPQETTKEMVEIVRVKREAERVKFQKIFDNQEKLVKELLFVIKTANEKDFIRIIREGEKNLERIGVVSHYVKSIIKQIEKSGGAGKICGGGGKTKGTGILLCYHPKKTVIEKIAKSLNLPYFSVALGVEGLKRH